MKAYFDSLDAEVFVFQETKVGSTMKDLEDSLLHIEGYESFWSLCTRKPGYSGVATYVKKGLTVDARREFGRSEFDCEGRVMLTDHGSFVLFNVYFPNSGNGDRLDYKMEFYKWFENLCDEYLKQGRQIIVAGDVNTTYGEIDIWCPEKLKQGLFEVERKWMEHLFCERTDSEPFVDTFRHLHPTWRKYSWWDVKSNMRITDQGYRLDYFIVNQKFLAQIIDSDMMTDQLGSDHCPIVLTLKPQEVPQTKNKIHQLSSEKIRASQPKISSFFTKQKKAPTPLPAPSSSSPTVLEQAHQQLDSEMTVLATNQLDKISVVDSDIPTMSNATSTNDKLEIANAEPKEKRERTIGEEGDERKDASEPDPKRRKIAD